MMTTVEFVETRISPDILDTIGKSFKFRHGSGIAEWLKNALDNYLRLRHRELEPRAGGWPAYICLADGASRRNGPNLAVIDFGGTTLQDIEEFFLYWGSRSAATLGGTLEGVAVTGGHGNGGKFYMRELWRDGARFLTWRDGRATSLVVQRRDDGRTGYWEFKDRRMLWREALSHALAGDDHLGEAKKLLAHLAANQNQLIQELDEKQRGLTVVVGRRAAQVLSSNDVVRGSRWDAQRLVDSIREAPQARRPLRELAVSVFVNGTQVIERLSLETVTDDPNWPACEIQVPSDLLLGASFATELPHVGLLRLRKASEPLSGRRRHYNVIFMLDRDGNPIGSYPLRELPMPGHSTLLDFVHGELSLTFPRVDDLVQNDRERLIPSPTTEKLLEWVADRVWEQVEAIEKAQRESAEKKELAAAAVLNAALNHHARRFLEQLQTEIYIDLIEDPEGGGPGPVGGEGTGGGGLATGGDGTGGVREVSGSSQKVRRPKFPQVLLYGYDPDPAAATGRSKVLTDRHPPLDQDDVDRAHNTWWINSEHPFAKEALRRGGAQGHAFRSYQLHMFRDVVQREVLRYRQRREAELPLDRVENELTDISNRFLADLPYDLIGELLD